MKPYRGNITNWRKISCTGGLGYFISGIACDQHSAPIVHTSAVVLHDANNYIETKFSGYTLTGPERKI